MTEISPASRPRIALIDIARGVAILAMIVYHFSWDLAFLGFVDFDPTQSLPWIIFQKSIVGTFIFLTGVSLMLAHADGIRWRAFWRRFLIIFAAALVVTAGTFAFSPATFVYFGVLHAIAAFSLLGLTFLRAPVVLTSAVALLFILAPAFVQSPLFGEKVWSWIGLWDVPPPSEDLVPFFPWFGVALAGIATTRLAMAKGWTRALARTPATAPIPRVLAKFGRWSLVIYVLHQPLMLGALTGIAALTGTADVRRADNFLASCQTTCSESAGDGEYCTAYCACALGSIEEQDLWSVLEAPQRTEQQETMLIGLTNQCATEVLDEQLLAPAQE